MFKTIPIKPEHHDAVKVLLEEKETALIAFHTAAIMFKQAKEKLWATLEEDYPEIKGCRASLDKKGMKIILLGTEG